MKKRIISLTLALLMALSLIACSGGEVPDSTPASTPASPGEQQTPAVQPDAPREPVHLTVGTIGQPEATSIFSQSGSLGKFNYNSITYANFFFPDRNNDMQPYFLDSYTISEDGRELAMTFPTTAVWHDGEPVTVDDVVFSFEYRRDVAGSKSLQNLTDIRVDGDDSITLIFSQPDAYYLVRNSGLTFFVIPRHIWENVDDYSSYTGDDAAIGCGPYRLLEVDQDAGIMRFESVPENAYLGELTIDTITLKSYSTTEAVLMALANGEIDVIYNYASPVSHTLLDVIANNENIDLGESGFIGCGQVTFGMNRQPNMDHAFREAAVKSLDWNLLAQLSNGEYGEIPGSGILPSTCPGYDPTLWKMYQDVDEAGAILDAAGYADTDGDGFRELPDGTKFTYKVTAQYSAARQDLFGRIGEVLVSSLQNIGVDAYFDQASIVNQEANKDMVANNDYDMFIGFTTSGVASYSTVFWYFLNREIAGGGAMAWGGSYHNEEFNAAYLSLREAVNNDQYLAAVGELQRIASEELFGFATCWERCFFPYRTDRFDGLENYPSIGVVHAEMFYNITPKA